MIVARMRGCNGISGIVVVFAGKEVLGLMAKRA